MFAQFQSFYRRFLASAACYAGLIAFVLGAQLCDAAKPVLVNDGRDFYIVGGQVEYLADRDSSYTKEDVLAGKYDADFFRIEGERPNFGFERATFWMRFTLKYSPDIARGPKQWWVEFEYPLLDVVDLYYTDKHGKLITEERGDLRLFKNNPVDFPRSMFEATLHPEESMALLFRVNNQSSQQLGINVMSSKGLADYASAIRLMDGIFLGIMLIMLFYNAFVFLAIRDVAYLYYVCAIGVFLFGQISLQGIAWQYAFWDDLQKNNTVIAVTLNLTWMFLLLFSRSFLQTKKHAPMIDGLLKFLALVSLWLIFLSPMVEYSFAIQLSTRMTTITSMMLTVIGIVLWRRGHRVARYFTLSWVGYMVGILLGLLYLFGFLPFSYINSNGIQIGAFANVLLLSLALADRINTQKRETDHARRRALLAREQAIEANERAVANLKMYRKLYEDASEGIFQASLDGRFISANPSLATILGYSSAEALICDIEDMADQCFHEPKEGKAFQQKVMEVGRIQNYEARYMRADGTSFWGSSSAHLVKDEQGNPAYLEGSLVDINERMEKEKAQREREAAEASASAKSEFLANMSHEIRTPMNAIIGFSTLAQKTDLDAKQRNYITKIEHSSKALLGIINDILDFSKIEAGKLSLEMVDFDLFAVVNDLVSILSQKAAEKNLELVMHVDQGVPANLVGDPLRLKQVLINLTNNAIKFTGEGEVVVRITESQTLEDKVMLQFSVIDTGIGITKAAQKNLFNPFTQADGSTTRKYGGTGLGLSISKQLVALMEGEVWVESKENEGSTFSFSAWFGLQQEQQHDDIYATKELKDMRILLVDDKDAGQAAIMGILNSFQCQATWLPPDYTLITTLDCDTEKDDYDLVIVDRQLHAMSSIEAGAGIQGLSAFAGVPIIVMTLSNEEELQEAALSKGFKVLVKPVTPSVLLDCIHEILGFSGTKSALALASEDQSKMRAALAGYHVLLVEDTPFNQEIASEFLYDVGISINLAENGKRALEILAIERFDAVLMDVQMPVMDGFDATRGIRNQLGLKDLPVIAMTANAMKGDEERCLAAGMNDYISKPVAQDILYQKLYQWIVLQTEQSVADRSVEIQQVDSKQVDHKQVDSEQSILKAKVTTEDSETMISENQSDQASAGAENKAIDLAKALFQMGGSEAFLKKMLKRFKDEQSDTVAKIRSAYDSGDTETAHRLAHTLKGIAGSLSAAELQAAAAALETALEGAVSTDELGRLLSKTQSAMQSVTDFISQLDGAEL